MPDAPPFEPRSPFETAFRTAIEGADAYRAVRAGLRLHDDILRIGNRFVSVDRFREIAFVALGNAAGSMALAAQEMLGERLTQGLTAGAVAPPDSLQFHYLAVPDPWPGSSPSFSALASTLELARDLQAEDLLLLLLSPGALSVTAGPPTGWEGSAWRQLLQNVTARAGPLDAVRVARVLGTGAVGGRLGALVREPTVVTLVLDRGEGAEWVGGGPTVSLRLQEASAVRTLMSGTSAVDLPRDSPPLLGRNVHRPVVVTGPIDAVEAAGESARRSGVDQPDDLAPSSRPSGPGRVAVRGRDGDDPSRAGRRAAPAPDRGGRAGGGRGPPVDHGAVDGDARRAAGIERPRRFRGRHLRYRRGRRTGGGCAGLPSCSGPPINPPGGLCGRAADRRRNPHSRRGRRRLARPPRRG